MNRFRDSGANHQKNTLAKNAAFIALIAIPIHPKKLLPFSKWSLAASQQNQTKNKLSNSPSIYTTATIKIITAAMGWPNNNAIMANIVPKNALSESIVVLHCNICCVNWILNTVNISCCLFVSMASSNFWPLTFCPDLIPTSWSAASLIQILINFTVFRRLPIMIGNSNLSPVPIIFYRSSHVISFIEEVLLALPLRTLRG